MHKWRLSLFIYGCVLTGTMCGCTTTSIDPSGRFVIEFLPANVCVELIDSAFWQIHDEAEPLTTHLVAAVEIYANGSRVENLEWWDDLMLVVQYDRFGHRLGSHGGSLQACIPRADLPTHLYWVSVTSSNTSGQAFTFTRFSFPPEQ